jgi:hypothetical protein
MAREYVKVDGTRFLVVMLHGKRGFVVRWTGACSGCVSDEECVSHDIGAGCYECGYTGKRRREEWLPLAEFQPQEKGPANAE